MFMMKAITSAYKATKTISWNVLFGCIYFASIFVTIFHFLIIFLKETDFMQHEYMIYRFILTSIFFFNFHTFLVILIWIKYELITQTTIVYIKLNIITSLLCKYILKTKIYVNKSKRKSFIFFGWIWYHFSQGLQAKN